MLVHPALLHRHHSPATTQDGVKTQMSRQGSQDAQLHEVKALAYPSTHLLHALYLRHIELQHVLNASLQCHDGAGAAGARALELQLHDAVLEASVQHIAAVLLHCWPVDGKAGLSYEGVQTEHQIIGPRRPPT